MKRLYTELYGAIDTELYGAIDTELYGAIDTERLYTTIKGDKASGTPHW